jgi:hypothetical protein
MSDLEQKNYVASNEDIEVITQSALEASHLAGASRATYLRALVGTTQQQLGMAVAKRKGVPAPVDEAETKRQLEALEIVQERFYAAVIKVVSAAAIGEEERSLDRATVYQRRATFARTSKAALRAWILSGHSLKSLVPAKVTKYALQAETQKRRGQPIRAPSTRFLTGFTERLMARIKAAKSPEDSIRLLETVISKLVMGLQDLGVETTTDLDDALENHKLLETDTGIVWVPQSQVEPPRAQRAA